MHVVLWSCVITVLWVTNHVVWLVCNNLASALHHHQVSACSADHMAQVLSVLSYIHSLV